MAILTRRFVLGGLIAAPAVIAAHHLMPLRGLAIQSLPPLPLGEAEGVSNSLGPLDLKLSQFGPASFSWATPENRPTVEDLIDLRDKLIEESSTVGPAYLSPQRYVRQRLVKWSFDPADYSIEVPDGQPTKNLFSLKYALSPEVDALFSLKYALSPEVDALRVENERLRNLLRKFMPHVPT